MSTQDRNMLFSLQVMYEESKSFLTFVYWVSVVILGLAVESALLASWQEAHYSNITTQWANAGLLIGVVVVCFFFSRWGRNPRMGVAAVG